MIGAEREPPYERPPLSKAYVVRPSAFYGEHGIEMIFGTRVARVDPTQRVVELEDHRRVPFDTLLLATGARNRILWTPGADLEGIYSLRTIHDVDRIRAEMRPGRRAVIVGMGFIGSEVAASLRQAGVDVLGDDLMMRARRRDVERHSRAQIDLASEPVDRESGLHDHTRRGGTRGNTHRQPGDNAVSKDGAVEQMPFRDRLPLAARFWIRP